MSARTSAGILAYRRRAGQMEVLLVHPGGPFFSRKDLGNWSIPKGEIDGNETLEAAARREFEEETGKPVPAGPLFELGSVRQKSGKIVHAWAVEADLDTATMKSNDIELEWPPFTGRHVRIPEVDKWRYFGPADVRAYMKEAQHPFLDRLAAWPAARADAAPETAPETATDGELRG
jgi:predicted NUDIX family NTP pyrophosphohydrolase